MSDTQVKISLRLPEVERRRFRMVALQRGLTAEQALRQAVDKWMGREATGNLPAPEPRPRSSTKPRPPGAGKPQPRPPKTNTPQTPRADSPASGSRPAKRQGSSSWSLNAMQLDWSQCPSAELVDSKLGKVWVFRGTRVLLTDLFLNLERGHAVEEIIAHFKGLNDDLVNSVMQFAGERMYIPGL